MPVSCRPCCPEKYDQLYCTVLLPVQSASMHLVNSRHTTAVLIVAVSTPLKRRSLFRAHNYYKLECKVWFASAKGLDRYFYRSKNQRTAVLFFLPTYRDTNSVTTNCETEEHRYSPFGTPRLFFSHHSLSSPLSYFSLPTRSSDPRSQSTLSSPLPTTVRAFPFIARILQPFLPSSTRVE